MSTKIVVATQKKAACQVYFQPKCGMIKTWLHGCINRFPKKEATFTENIRSKKGRSKKHKPDFSLQTRQAKREKREVARDITRAFSAERKDFK